MIVPVAGVAAMGSDLTGIEIGDPAVLVAEPDNPYDSSAIAVWVRGRHVGYLQRELAARLARLAGDPPANATVAQVLFHDGRPSGLRLELP